MKFRYLIPLFASLCLAACSEKSPGGEEPPVPDNFGISVSGTTTWTADVTWKAASADQTYIAMVTDKATFDTYASDEAYVASDVAYFKALAEYLETDLETVLTQFMTRGTSDQHVTDLKSDTEYYAYAFGIKSDGTVTTPLTKTLFRTQAVQDVACSFTFATTQLGATSTRIFITPSNESCSYFWNYVTRAEYDAFGDKDGVIATNIDLIRRAVEIFQMAGQDKTFADFLDSGVTFGEPTELKPETEYVVFAFGLDPSGIATTALMKDTFRTKAVTASSMTFRTELLNNTFNGARISFIPSSSTEKYFTDCIDYKTYAEATSDEEFMAGIVAQAGASINSFLTSGTHVVDASGMLRSNTRYVAYAFGYADGITTGLTKLEFTTPAMPAGGNAIVGVVPTIEDGNTYYERDEILYASYKDKAVVRNALTPSPDAAHWYIAAFKADISGFSDSEVAEMLRTNGYADRQELGLLVDWDAVLYVAAVAVDAQDRSGAVARITVRADRQSVSPSAIRAPGILVTPFDKIPSGSVATSAPAAKASASLRLPSGGFHAASDRPAPSPRSVRLRF